MTLTVKHLRKPEFKEPMVIFPLKQYETLMAYLKDIADRLSIKIAFKLKAAIDNLSENQRPPNCTKLEGSLDEYRIRIGK